jgi:hypothetical protein
MRESAGLVDLLSIGVSISDAREIDAILRRFMDILPAENGAAVGMAALACAFVGRCAGMDDATIKDRLCGALDLLSAQDAAAQQH